MIASSRNTGYNNVKQTKGPFMKYLMMIMYLFMFSSCAIVGPGQKGVHMFFGNPSSETGSGITPWFPFVYGLTKFDLRVQKHVIETTAASKDLQPLDAHIAVNWRIDPSNLTGFYKDVGDEDDAVEKIISPSVNEVVKAATAKLTAEEIVGRRSELKKEIDVTLQVRLEKYGLHCDDVSIVNVSFSKEFTDAIEAKQIAEQQTKQADYLSQKATMDAKAVVNTARGSAEAQLINAEAQAKSQKLLQSSLTHEMLQKLALDKWDGAFPQVMGTSTLPFINIKTNTQNQ